MSEDKSSKNPAHSEWECAICGRDGGPSEGCPICHGNKRYLQKRHFTMTEERQGMNTEEKSERYGDYGEVNPRVVDLPGSFNPMINVSHKKRS